MHHPHPRPSATAERRAGRVGVWVACPDKPVLPDGSPREDKIAAIGVRIRHWGVVPRPVDQRRA
jgi:lipoyl(octanoyl) transferase